jgi:hypothetical protein
MTAILRKKEISYGSEAKNKVDLAALFFPKEKVTAYAADLGIKDVKTLEL